MNQKIKDARYLLVRKFPYLSGAVYNMRVVETSLPDGAMAVDNRWNMYYDPAQIDRFSVEQVAGGLFHEVWHLLGLHHQRLQHYPHLIANLGGDCAINSAIRAMRVQLPDNGVYPDMFHLPDGKSAEFYCEQLMQNSVAVTICVPGGQSGSSGQQQQQRGGGQSGGNDQQQQSAGGSGSQQQPDQESSGQQPSRQRQSDRGARGSRHGESGVPDGFDGLLVPGHGSCAHGRPESYEVDGSGLPQAVQQAIIKQVAQGIKSQGDAPDWMKRWADDVLTTRTDWRKLLRNHLFSAIADSSGRMDYTWNRHSRRQALTDVVLPRLAAPKPGVHVIVDTSGSMADEELALALAEIKGIASCASSVHVYSADTEIHTAHRIFSPGQVSSIDLVGGGGTSMRRAAEQVLERDRRRPAILVIITDGYTDWPDRQPGVGMIAVLTTEQDVPSHIQKVRIERDSGSEPAI